MVQTCTVPAITPNSQSAMARRKKFVTIVSHVKTSFILKIDNPTSILIIVRYFAIRITGGVVPVVHRDDSVCRKIVVSWMKWGTPATNGSKIKKDPQKPLINGQVLLPTYPANKGSQVSNRETMDRTHRIHIKGNSRLSIY